MTEEQQTGERPPSPDRSALTLFARAFGVVALGGVIVLSGINGSLLDTGAGNAVEFLGGALAGAVAIAFALVVVKLAARLAGLMPATFWSLLLAACLAAMLLLEFSPAEILRTVLAPDDWSWPLSWPTGLDLSSILVLVLAAGFLAGWISLLIGRRYESLTVRQRGVVGACAGVTVITAVVLVVGLLSDGSDPYETAFTNFEPGGVATLPDPTASGPYTVLSMSYGAGDNLRRPEFGSERDLESRTVDATAILPEWKGLKASMRERFWGFGLEDAPLNGLVWAPDGEGPFPLVLIVHGNHGMEDYSDAGYAYLGELLASRGYIAVSVDENFINGSWSGDFRGREMPARAWFLLEHLALWRDWNLSPDHRFAGKVDLDNISLIGHSRGGEAVSIAYAYNDLAHYPDDATLAFDYGFSIRSLVAIAQVDQRYHRRVELDNVSFLALQGSYDSDEPAFHGLRQYNRIHLDGEDYHFKAGIYLHGANHGQFNSTWGREDYGPPQAWLLNTAPIIPPEDQRQVAAAYISAFLDVTLKQESSYLALFQDPRTGSDWLPDHPYVQQFTDSTFRALANFDDDLDVLTGSVDGSTISTEGFSLWREEALTHRDERPQGSNAVVLGWSETDNPAYTLTVPRTYWSGVEAAETVFTLSISASTESPPDDGDEEEADSDDSTERASPRVSVEALHTTGRVLAADSADYAVLAPPLEVQYLKHKGENDRRYNDSWEPVLQVLDIPLTALTGDGSVADIGAIRLRFDQMPSAVVLLDEIGIRRAMP